MKCRFLLLAALVVVFIITTADAGKKNKGNNGGQNSNNNKTKNCKVKKCKECVSGNNNDCARCKNGFNLEAAAKGKKCVKERENCEETDTCAKVASTVSFKWGPMAEQDLKDEYTLENSIRVTESPKILQTTQAEGGKTKKSKLGTKFTVMETSLFSVSLLHGHKGQQVEFKVGEKKMKGKGNKKVKAEIATCGSDAQCSGMGDDENDDDENDIDDEGIPAAGGQNGGNGNNKKKNKKNKKKKDSVVVLNQKWAVGQTLTAKVHAKKLNVDEEAWHVKCNITMQTDSSSTEYYMATYHLHHKMPMDIEGFRSVIRDTQTRELAEGYKYTRRAEFKNATMTRLVGETMEKKEFHDVEFTKDRLGVSSFAHDLAKAGYNASSGFFYLSTGSNNTVGIETHNIHRNTSIAINRDQTVISIIET